MEDKFVVTPDSFTQEQWCEMYVTVVNEYQNLKNNYNNILKKVDKAIEFMKENCDIITLNNGWIIRSELTTTGLGKLFKILNGGNDNE